MNLRLVKLITLIALLLPATAAAQATASLGGIIQYAEELPEGTRVAVFQVDADGVWGRELATVTPIAGTFSLTLDVTDLDNLRPFRSGAILLPGLQNEYRVEPEGVQFALGRMNMYVDRNDSGSFDRQEDPVFLGLLSLELPVGFYNILYVDRDATIVASDATIQLQAGWNIFTVRFPGNDAPPAYEAVTSVSDAVLDVFLAEPEPEATE